MGIHSIVLHSPWSADPYYNQTVPVNLCVIIYGMITFTCVFIAYMQLCSHSTCFGGGGQCTSVLEKGSLAPLKGRWEYPPSPREGGESIPHSREGEGTVYCQSRRGWGDSISQSQGGERGRTPQFPGRWVRGRGGGGSTVQYILGRGRGDQPLVSRGGGSFKDREAGVHLIPGCLL